MKFLKEWSSWNPVLNKEVLDFIEKNKSYLIYNFYDKEKSDEENMQMLIDYFTEYPDEMKSSINSKNIRTILPVTGLRNSSPILQNIGVVKDFKSF